MRDVFQRKNFSQAMADSEYMLSPLNGSIVKKIISDLPEDVNYVVPVTLFFDEVSEVTFYGLTITV